jgi:5-methylcytosine-specific restriction endonuclease McrA
MRGRAWVEINPENKIIRIFKNRQRAVTSEAFEDDRVREYSRKDAIGEIRKAVFERSKGICEFCGNYLTEQTGDLHEQLARGLGGEISLENSVFICRGCHKAQHPEKQLRFGETSG